MGRTITLDLDAVEAHLAIGAITKDALEAAVTAAHAKGSKAEEASIRASVLNRVAGRIADGLIPEDPRTHILRQEAELGML